MYDFGENMPLVFFPCKFFKLKEKADSKFIAYSCFSKFSTKYLFEAFSGLKKQDKAEIFFSGSKVNAFEDLTP
jgi:hypothetical protein